MTYTARDILTPANAITLIGMLITLVGCFWLDTSMGLALVFFGRLLDLVDGPVARATQTTKFSVFFDPTADKIALAGILTAVIYYDLAPLPIVLYIIAQNLAVSVLSIIAQRQNKAVGALIPGKLNLFLQTSSIFLFIIAHLISNNWSSTLTMLGYLSFLASLPFALLATKSYADLLKEKNNTEAV